MLEIHKYYAGFQIFGRWGLLDIKMNRVSNSEGKEKWG